MLHSLAQDTPVIPLHTSNSTPTSYHGLQNPEQSGPDRALSPPPQLCSNSFSVPQICQAHSCLCTCPILPLVILNGWFLLVMPNSGLPWLSNLTWLPSHRTSHHSLLIPYVTENHYLLSSWFTASPHTRIWAPQKQTLSVLLIVIYPIPESRTYKTLNKHSGNEWTNEWILLGNRWRWRH